MSALIPICLDFNAPHHNVRVSAVQPTAVAPPGRRANSRRLMSISPDGHRERIIYPMRREFPVSM